MESKKREPPILLRGKEFHNRVQRDWAGDIAGGRAHRELTVLFSTQVTATRRKRHGRVDILVDELGDFVAVIEIKSTDWDAVKPANRRKLLASHRRQVWKYVEKYLDHDGVSVCAGIVYPQSPTSPGLKQEVERYLNNHFMQVEWYDDPR